MPPDFFSSYFQLVVKKITKAERHFKSGDDKAGLAELKHVKAMLKEFGESVKVVNRKPK